MQVDLAVLGGGPGGYNAAFRAADLGLKTALIERYPNLGGVCLNVGCIPSKALLHVAEVITAAAQADAVGVRFAAPQVELAQTRRWQAGIVQQLTRGLAGLAKKRHVAVVHGVGQFTSPHSLAVQADAGVTEVRFKQAVVAAGSSPLEIAQFPHADARVMNSTDALRLDDIPPRLLVVGGGVIGLELACVYHALGSRISVVEQLDTLLAGADADLLRPLQQRIAKQYENIWLNTRVCKLEALKGGSGEGGKGGIRVTLDGADAPKQMTFDKALVCVGRAPNGHLVQGEAAGLAIDQRGFIGVDRQQRTNVPHIFAIGDIVGQPMLAHKATHQGKVAAEVAAGMNSEFAARAIANVAYTDPEVAWVGLTEHEAKRQGLAYRKGSFPWVASGRALAQGAAQGVTKLLFDEQQRIIGAGVTGAHAGDLIAEAALAIEMGAEAEDIGLTIHPHPTLAETLGLAAEAFAGVITDLYLPKKP